MAEDQHDHPEGAGTNGAARSDTETSPVTCWSFDRRAPTLAASAAGLSIPSTVCPRCQKRSFNLHDIAERYCGACHRFYDD